MIEGRIVIIPFLQGIVDFDGTVTEPDIEAILEMWLLRHPEFQGPERDYQIIRAASYFEDGIDVGLVRVTAAVSPDLESYDPAEDADLYEEFLHESEPSAPREFHKIWIDQCEAAEQIEADYGTEKALGYLIGEKLLNFLEVAEAKPEWRAEISDFIAKIKEIFKPWQIAEFFEESRRLGVWGHVADDEEHRLFRSQVDESVNLREDARNLLLFERAREWLLEDGTDNTEMHP
jgi:hypothetical protein